MALGRTPSSSRLGVAAVPPTRPVDPVRREENVVDVGVQVYDWAMSPNT